MANQSGWNLWVWLAGGGCEWNIWMWLVGVVVRRYIYILYIYIYFLILLTLLLLYLFFFAAASILLFIKKIFFVLIPVRFL